MTRPPWTAVLYIAGPYSARPGSADPDLEIRQNIMKAEAAARAAWQAGWVPICPHMNSAGGEHLPGVQQEDFLAGDLEILRRCDALLAIEDWSLSAGARGEVAFARANGIPVFYLGDGMPTPDHLDRVGAPAHPIGPWSCFVPFRRVV